MAFNNNNMQPKKKFTRINHYITGVYQVRLFIESDLVGIVSIEDARRRAQDLGLDLVEIVPQAKPPVCKIIDFGKFKYEENIRKKEEVKKRKTVASKEIQFRYCTGQHDLETKVNVLKKFLEEKRQVRVIVKFKNREMMFKKQGEELLQKIAVMIEEVGVLIPPRMEGKDLIAQVNPK